MGQHWRRMFPRGFHGGITKRLRHPVRLWRKTSGAEGGIDYRLDLLEYSVKRGTSMQAEGIT